MQVFRVGKPERQESEGEVTWELHQAKVGGVGVGEGR